MKQIFDAIEDIRSNKKRIDCIYIHDYITRHNATNLVEKAVQKAIKVLVDKTLLINVPEESVDSYNIIPQDQENFTILGRSGKESHLIQLQ